MVVMWWLAFRHWGLSISMWSSFLCPAHWSRTRGLSYSMFLLKHPHLWYLTSDPDDYFPFLFHFPLQHSTLSVVKASHCLSFWGAYTWLWANRQSSSVTSLHETTPKPWQNGRTIAISATDIISNFLTDPQHSFSHLSLLQNDLESVEFKTDLSAWSISGYSLNHLRLPLLFCDCMYLQVQRLSTMALMKLRVPSVFWLRSNSNWTFLLAKLLFYIWRASLEAPPPSLI